MPVHIEQLNTEMVLEPDGAQADGPADTEPTWRSVDRARALRSRVDKDRCRTRAKGFDD